MSGGGPLRTTEALRNTETLKKTTETLKSSETLNRVCDYEQRLIQPLPAAWCELLPAQRLRRLKAGGAPGGVKATCNAHAHAQHSHTP